MKRLIVIVLAAAGLAAAAIPPAQADPYQGTADEQTVQGTVMFPTRYTDGTAGWPGLVRRFYDATGEDGNGIIGWVFQVDPLSIGGSFTLTVDSQGPLNDADLDIGFYNELGDTAGSVSPGTTAGYATHAGSGETGFVPRDSRYGIVYMANGENVAFTYTAQLPMGVEVNEAGFGPADVTVKAGAWVNFQNVGADNHGATGNDGSWATGADAKHPIQPGEAVMVQFLTPGTYAYHDPFSTATGVIHVVDGPGPGGDF